MQCFDILVTVSLAVANAQSNGGCCRQTMPTFQVQPARARLLVESQLC